MQSLPTISTAEARHMLLAGAGLLDDPARRAGPSSVAKIVSQLGFVQIDSIQRVARAHHLILGARLDGYRESHLEHAAFRRRKLFEHWTHDAALIPVEWFQHWKPRFARSEARLRKSRWFSHRLGPDADKIVAAVFERVTRDGPVRSSDFERQENRPATGWWDWTPEKTALEFLWHTGRLAVCERENFQKVYDLTERVFPEWSTQAAPHAEVHVQWCCEAAIRRLGAATPGELAAFWNAITIAEAAKWCRSEHAAGRLLLVSVESANGVIRKAYAPTDWPRRARRGGSAPDRIRLLAPFDPVLRDRDRALRLFAFDYRFEAFVPAKRRKYGYYVLPMLEGDRLVGRIDPSYSRETKALIVRKVWWEGGVKPTKLRRRKLQDALAILAAQIGASQIQLPKSLK